MLFKKGLIGYKPSGVAREIARIKDEHSKQVEKLNAEIVNIEKEIMSLMPEKTGLQQRNGGNNQDMLVQLLLDKYMSSAVRIYEKYTESVSANREEKQKLEMMEQKYNRINESLKKHIEDIKNVIDNQ